MEDWEIRVTDEILDWINSLDDKSKAQVVDAIDRLAEGGPGLAGLWSTGWKALISTT